MNKRIAKKVAWKSGPCSHRQDRARQAFRILNRVSTGTRWDPFRTIANDGTKSMSFLYGNTILCMKPGPVSIELISDESPGTHPVYMNTSLRRGRVALDISQADIPEVLETAEEDAGDFITCGFCLNWASEAGDSLQGHAEDCPERTGIYPDGIHFVPRTIPRT